MSDLVNLTFDVDQVLALPAAIERQYLIAAKRSLKRTASWGRTRIVRAIAASTHAKVSLLRRSRRIQSALRASDTSLVLWAGLNDATSALFGTPVQAKAGAVLGGTTYAGAFTARVTHTSIKGPATITKTGPAIIFERSTLGGAPRIEDRPRSINKWGRTTLPIKPLPFGLGEAREPILALKPAIESQLQTEITRQLDYALHHEGRP